MLRNDGLVQFEEFRVEADSPTLSQLQQVWEKHLLNAVAEPPSVAPDEIDAGTSV